MFLFLNRNLALPSLSPSWIIVFLKHSFLAAVRSMTSQPSMSRSCQATKTRHGVDKIWVCSRSLSPLSTASQQLYCHCFTDPLEAALCVRLQSYLFLIYQLLVMSVRCHLSATSLIKSNSEFGSFVLRAYRCRYLTPCGHCRYS